jgi:two-component system sensor histidine kinase DegS
MPLTSKTLSRIIDGSAIPSFVINKEHIITHWNTALEALTGRKREDVIGRDNHWASFYSTKRPSMADLIVEEAPVEEVEKYYQNKFKKSPLIDGAYEAEDYFTGLSGNGAWLHFTASPIKDENGEIIGAIETLVDVTERKVLEDNLRYYLQQITRAHEEERKYIARELHDDMAQILGSLSRELDNILRRKSDINSAEVSDLQDFRNRLNQGLQSVHRFIQNLRPSLLDDLGLIPALRSLTNSLEDSEGMLTEFTVTGDERILTNEDAVSLFRLVQEALNNIKKHAHASEASISVEWKKASISLTINDNGKGFKPPKSMDDLPRSGQLGLMGMQERVWLMGGTMNIHSEPGKGTSLQFDVLI